MNDCSDEFWECMDRSGGCRMECRCGREHFDVVNRYDWNEGELEGLEALAKSEPDKYIAHHGCVEGAYFNGHVAIRGCPCNFLAALEQIIIFNDHNFAKFLNQRSKELAERAKAIAVSGVLAGHNHTTAKRLIELYGEVSDQPESVGG